MDIYMDESAFLEAIKSSFPVSGKFKFDFNGESLMDLDLKDINFENCEMHGGVFASSDFRNCTFTRVIFRESVFAGVVFTGCRFNQCRFSNIKPDFDIKNCDVKAFTVTEETIEVALRPWSPQD